MKLESIGLDALGEAELKALAANARWKLTLVPDFGENDRDKLETFYRRPLELVGGSRCTDCSRCCGVIGKPA